MNSVSTKKSPWAAAFALAALLGWAGSALAIQVVGRWDPPYGSAFPNLGWNGEATFEVPADCLASTGASISFSPGSCASRVDVLGAQVNFYDTNGTNNNSSDDTQLGTMTWTGLGDQAALPDVYFTRFGGGTMQSVVTGFFDFLPSPTTFAGTANYSFALLFVGTNVVLINRTCDGAQCQYGINDFASEAGRAVVTFTPAIPEPHTYALMLAGLGAIGLVARRRRRH